MSENPVLRHYKYPETLTQAMQNAVDYIDKFLFNYRSVHTNRVIYLTLELQFGTLPINSVFRSLNTKVNTKVDIGSFERTHLGWQGKLWFAVEKPLIYPKHTHTMSATKLLKEVCICPSQGFEVKHPLKEEILNYDKHYKWGFNSKIFLDDWPSLQMHAIVDPNDPQIKLERKKGKDFLIHIINKDFALFPSKHPTDYKRQTNVYQ